MSAADPRELQAVLGGARAPATLTREDRVQLLARAARLLMASETVEGTFTGGGILAWLANEGDLLRDCWKVAGPAGSHRTPASVWRELRESSSRGAQESEGADTLVPSPSKSERRK